MGDTAGPLAGVSVIDVSTMGPGPFASMVLADFGAEVIEIRRPVPNEVDAADQFVRGKQQLTIDLRAPGGAELIARLTDAADVFLEGYRPGTMERRGLGPAVLMERNPRLVYTRLTGWGQDGPYAGLAGHDINYVAIGGPLGAVGHDAPVPALNLLGDFASGSFPAVLGTVLALLARERTGRGQVVDAGMVDGAAYLLFAQFCELGLGQWHGRGTGMLSGAAPFYGVYQCADGRWMSVGSIESKFYTRLLDGLGLGRDLLARQYDRAHWPADRAVIARVFAAHPRDHWAAAVRRHRRLRVPGAGSRGDRRGPARRRARIGADRRRRRVGMSGPASPAERDTRDRRRAQAVRPRRAVRPARLARHRRRRHQPVPGIRRAAPATRLRSRACGPRMPHADAYRAGRRDRGDASYER